MKEVGVNGGDGAGQEDEKEEVIKSGNACELKVEPRKGGRGRGYIIYRGDIQIPGASSWFNILQ